MLAALLYVAPPGLGADECDHAEQDQDPGPEEVGPEQHGKAEKEDQATEALLRTSMGGLLNVCRETDQDEGPRLEAPSQEQDAEPDQSQRSTHLVLTAGKLWHCGWWSERPH